jgi:hypothetical protein
MRLAALRQFTKILGVDRDDGARLGYGKFPQLMVGRAQQAAIADVNGIHVVLP